MHVKTFSIKDENYRNFLNIVNKHCNCPLKRKENMVNLNGIYQP